MNMGWVHKYWPRLVGGAVLFLTAIRGLGDLDFVVSRVQEPGWIGTLMNLFNELPGWVFLVLGVVGLVLILWDLFWRQKSVFSDDVTHIKTLTQREYNAIPNPSADTLYIVVEEPNKNLTAKDSGVTLSPRIPLLSLLDFAERSHGWDFTSRESLHLLDFVYGLRQVGSDGGVRFWGKPNRNSFEQLTRNELLVVIPPEHWRDYEFEVFKARQERDNFYICTLNKRQENIAQGSFCDVHIEGETARHWLSHQADAFKGHTRH